MKRGDYYKREFGNALAAIESAFNIGLTFGVWAANNENVDVSDVENNPTVRDAFIHYLDEEIDVKD